MAANDTDAALMARVRAGDEAAFRELIERHQRGVFNLIYRSIGDAWEAEDLAQRVFLQVFRSAHRYQPNARFTTWLYTITHNLIRNEYRRRQRRSAESLDALTDDEDNPWQVADAAATDPARAAAERELRERIRAAIEQLPAAQRTAVILCRYEGLAYEEIAAVLGCSVAAVKSLLHRARQSLKEMLRGCY